jgi:hypothetical protein
VKGKAKVSWGGYPAQEFSGADLAIRSDLYKSAVAQVVPIKTFIKIDRE